MRFLCRMALHRWRREGKGETMTMRCRRCGKERDPNPMTAAFGAYHGNGARSGG